MNTFQWLLEMRTVRQAACSRKSMDAYRDACVRRLVEYAYRHVPYYRRLLDGAGVSAADIRGVADLTRIPITTKSDLRAHAGDSLSDRVPAARLLPRYTTGSSGEPFHISRSMAESVFGLTLGRRRRAEYGRRVGDVTAVITMHADAASPSFPLALAKRIVRPYTGHRVHFSSREDTDRLVEKLEGLRPDLVLGYAGILAELGERLAGRRRTGWRPRYLLSGSETLTALRRRQIEDGFGAPVYDFYAAYETGMIAWECPSTGLYHVADDHVVLELDRDGQAVRPEDGAEGETIVTNLHAYAMPFIRYRLSDAVVRGPSTCPCGAPYSTLRSVLGRFMDYFVFPGDRRIHPLGIVRSFIKDCPCIRQYQIIQETLGRIVVRVSLVPSLPFDSLNMIPTRIREYLGFNVDVRVDVLDRIEAEPSGKHRVFVSRVSAPSDKRFARVHDDGAVGH